MKQRKFHMFLILFLGLPTVARADSPEAFSCTKQQICLAHSRMMEGELNGRDPVPMINTNDQRGGLGVRKGARQRSATYSKLAQTPPPTLVSWSY